MAFKEFWMMYVYDVWWIYSIVVYIVAGISEYYLAKVNLKEGKNYTVSDLVEFVFSAGFFSLLGPLTILGAAWYHIFTFNGLLMQNYRKIKDTPLFGDKEKT